VIADRRRRAGALIALPAALALSGCYGYTSVGAEVPIGVPVVLADEVPLYLETYPRYYYGGAYVYLAGGRWYYPSGGRWYVLREEPPPLARYRASLPPRYYAPTYRGYPISPPVRRYTAPPAYSYPGGRRVPPPAYTYPRAPAYPRAPVPGVTRPPAPSYPSPPGPRSLPVERGRQYVPRR
jgi:hypothetical protein